MVADVLNVEPHAKQDCGVRAAGVDSVTVCSADAQIKCACALGGVPVNKSFHSEDAHPCSSQIKQEAESKESDVLWGGCTRSQRSFSAELPVRWCDSISNPCVFFFLRGGGHTKISSSSSSNSQFLCFILCLNVLNEEARAPPSPLEHVWLQVGYF